MVTNDFFVINISHDERNILGVVGLFLDHLGEGQQFSAAKEGVRFTALASWACCDHQGSKGHRFSYNTV